MDESSTIYEETGWVGNLLKDEVLDGDVMEE